MNDTTKQKITKSLDYSGDDSGAYFNEGELEPLTPEREPPRPDLEISSSRSAKFGLNPMLVNNQGIRLNNNNILRFTHCVKFRAGEHFPIHHHHHHHHHHRTLYMYFPISCSSIDCSHRQAILASKKIGTETVHHHDDRRTQT